MNAFRNAFVTVKAWAIMAPRNVLIALWAILFLFAILTRNTEGALHTAGAMIVGGGTVALLFYIRWMVGILNRREEDHH